MSKTDKLNDLFDRWVEKSEYKGKFVRDGIIDERVYNKQKSQKNPRILFICKEMNDPKQKERDFRVAWNDPNNKKNRFGTRICQWAYGIQNGFPRFGDIRLNDAEKFEIGKTIAFMNLKKVAGGSKAVQSEIQDAANVQRDFIAKEIKIIKPDIIIGGIGFDPYLWEIMFPRIRFHDPKCAVIATRSKSKAAKQKSKVAKYNSYKIIDYYHPSYQWISGKKLYEQLRNVFQSKEFQKL